MASWSNGIPDRDEPAPPGAGLTDRSALASIIGEYINPGASRRDRGSRAPRSVHLRQARRDRDPGSVAAAGDGGGGADWHRWGQDLRQLAYLADELSLPFTISIQQSIAKQLLRSGRPELIHRHVPP
jgi:hypothetical protein